jgi:hypothetical protein
MNHATTEIAAMVIEKSFLIQRSSLPGDIRTSATFREDFYQEKHRLSGKPLRRPARRRPAASSASVEPAAEEAARQLLQHRMPPRSRIQVILDRRPARDPWLDDEYDWRP